MAESTVAPVYADTGLHDVLVASGYGVTLSVRNGHLVVTDGTGRARRERRVPRMPQTVKRLTVIGYTGYLSLEAVRWLSDVSVPWAQLDSEGRILATSGPARVDTKLLRAQATAEGLEITRDLIARKLDGQARLLHDLLPAPESEAHIRARAADVSAAGSMSAILGAEGQAASAYWDAWVNRVAVPWSPPDLVKVPHHWRVFTQRPSLAAPVYENGQHGGSPNRNATDPIGALLNFAYRIGEAECVHACHAAGLHPALGFSHTDKLGRDSLALDLLEVIRPQIDCIVLSVLAPDGLIPYNGSKPAYFDRRWVTETRDGTCRLVPPVTNEIAGHAAELARSVLPVALDVARVLASETTGHRNATAKLTGRRVEGQPRAHRGYPRANLRPGVTAADVITDALWREIEPKLPSRAGRPGRKPGYDERVITASLVARFLLGCPYRDLPAKLDRTTLDARHRELVRAGVWDHVCQVLTSAGHLDSLTA